MVSPKDTGDFSKGLLLAFKRAPFGVQKDSFCGVKGLLFECKRAPFGILNFEF